jgi:hypothetical protein
MNRIKFLVVASCLRIQAASSHIDTLTVRMTPDSARNVNSNWAEKFRHETVSQDKVLSDDSIVTFKSIYKVPRLALEFQFQVFPRSDDSSLVVLKASSPLSGRLMERLHKNILASVNQAYGFEVPGVHEYHRKSALAYLGFSLLNYGAGMAYADYHSFILDESPWITIGGGASDLLAIGLMFSDDGATKGVGIGLYAFYKLMGLIGLANINLHNQVTATGYKYYF